jgi:hypothetical protein
VRLFRHSLIIRLAVLGVLMHAMLPLAHALAMSVPDGIATTLCSVEGNRTVYVESGKPAPQNPTLLNWPCPLCVAGALYALPPGMDIPMLGNIGWQHVQVAAPFARWLPRNAAVHFSSRAPPLA